MLEKTCNFLNTWCVLYMAKPMNVKLQICFHVSAVNDYVKISYQVYSKMSNNTSKFNLKSDLRSMTFLS